MSLINYRGTIADQPLDTVVVDNPEPNTFPQNSMIPGNGFTGQRQNIPSQNYIDRVMDYFNQNRPVVPIQDVEHSYNKG